MKKIKDFEEGGEKRNRGMHDMLCLVFNIKSFNVVTGGMYGMYEYYEVDAPKCVLYEMDALKCAMSEMDLSNECMR